MSGFSSLPPMPLLLIFLCCCFPLFQALVQHACGKGTKLSAEAEVALKAVAGDFVAGALGFGATMARRKRAQALDPADLCLYFKQTW